MYCDDIQDMDLTTALQSSMGLFVDHINTKTNSTNEIIKINLYNGLILKPYLSKHCLRI